MQKCVRCGNEIDKSDAQRAFMTGTIHSYCRGDEEVPATKILLCDYCVMAFEGWVLDKKLEIGNEDLKAKGLI